MAGKVGTAKVINFAYTTSAEAQYTRAKFGVAGNTVDVRHTTEPLPISHLITETGTSILFTETTDKQFITEGA